MWYKFDADKFTSDITVQLNIGHTLNNAVLIALIQFEPALMSIGKAWQQSIEQSLPLRNPLPKKRRE